MKTLYNLIIIVFLIPNLFWANEKNYKHKKEKVITKTFVVNHNATLKVDNSYGNLEVITWEKNEMAFEITITTSGNDEEKVEDKLNDITVEFTNASDLVTAITKFSKKRTKSWWNWGNNNVNMKVNYLIKIPMTSDVNLENDYGSINLDRLEGNATLSCDYGKITTKELFGNQNVINFDYTDNSYFEYIENGSINADYSGFTVAKTKQLKINADYTKSKVEIAENVSYNCDYGSITLEKINTVKGNGDYLTVRIGDVYKDVDIEADYGSIKIENLTKNTGNVFINSDYVGIKIGYASDFHFNFELDLEYASLRDQDDFQFSKKRNEYNEKFYRGYYGSENSTGLVKINSDYGSVSFYKN